MSSKNKPLVQLYIKNTSAANTIRAKINLVLTQMTYNKNKKVKDMDNSSGISLEETREMVDNFLQESLNLNADLPFNYSHAGALELAEEVNEAFQEVLTELKSNNIEGKDGISQVVAQVFKGHLHRVKIFQDYGLTPSESELAARVFEELNEDVEVSFVIFTPEEIDLSKKIVAYIESKFDDVVESANEGRIDDMVAAIRNLGYSSELKWGVISGRQVKR
jgi:hypothetical protein